MKSSLIPPEEKRILVLSPIRQEAQACSAFLKGAGISCTHSNDMEELCRHLESGAGGAIIAEEAILAEDPSPLHNWIRDQPTWSDFPILLLTGSAIDTRVARPALPPLGNVVLIPRPVGEETLVNIAHAGLRMRMRQYHSRERMEQLAKAREAAEEGTRAKSDFLSVLSHELRTPLTVFLGAIDQLLEFNREPDQNHLLALAKKSACRLEALIKDILDFSRLEANEIELNEEPFDLRGCVTRVAEETKPLAGEKGLALKVEVAENVPRIVRGDSARLEQVLIHLVGNAVKFTPQGEIGISVIRHGNTIEFAVADTGIGVPEEKRDLIFKKFTQLDGSFTRSFGGTGLGLALSKMLVELMGGKIAFQTGAEKGSIFAIRVPLKPVGTTLRVEYSAGPECGKTITGNRILLAEDEPLVREMLSLMLSTQGWQAETALSGREAVEKWQNGSFDLIFMDLQMPDMNGLEATLEIRKRETERDKRTCIIGLTAYTLRDIKDNCLKVGMDRVLTKPVQIKDLTAAITDCLSK